MPNGGFEEYYSCPISNDLNNGQLELAKGWWKPTAGTSDYFNRCNNGIVGVPSNFWGYQEAFEGNGYVGFGACSWDLITGNFNGLEYVQARLKKKLVECAEYSFNMKISLANRSKYSFTKIGALFYKDSLSINNENPITYTPQVYNTTPFLKDTSEWMNVSGKFIANGNENFILIGYFFDSLNQDTLLFPNSNSFTTEGYGYYYIDNVSLIETGIDDKCGNQVPNFFTPNGDGINDKWEYQSIEEGDLSILNRWGVEVFHKKKALSFQWNGENLADGVYFYKFYSENTIKTGFIHLIR